MTTSQTDFGAGFHAALESQKAGRLDEAWSGYLTLLRMSRDVAAVWNNLGLIARDRGDHDGAIALMLRARQCTDAASAPNPNLKAALIDARRTSKLLDMLVIEVAERHSEAALTAADRVRLLRSDGRLAAARRLLDPIRSNPKAAATAKFDLAQVLLGLGAYEQGFDALEARWETSLWSKKRRFDRRWDGHTDLGGKSVALFGEQGLGDMIFSLRFLPALRAAKPASVTAVASPPLVPLLAQSGLFDAIRTKAEFGDEDCDVVLYDTDLTTRFWSLPAPDPAPLKRLEIPDDRLTRANAVLGPARHAALRVGLCWTTDSTSTMKDRKRVAVSDLTPLLETPGATFVSLVKPGTRNELVAASLDGLVVDAGRHDRDLLDTAAMIKCLDLVITIDTAVAHIASSMGRPVWMMTPEPPYWYWNAPGENSPHYASLRVIRQSRRGDWTDVVSRIRHDLVRLQAQRESSTT